MSERSSPWRRVSAVTGALGVLAALGARRPVIRRWPASVVQALPCLPASEVPGAMSVLHGVAGVAAALSGAWAGAVGHALAVVALDDLRRDAGRSARVLDAALARLPRVPGPPGRVVGGRRARAEHLRAADVAYGEHPAQRLDVWGPVGATDAPVLIQVHGGGWTGGDKTHAASPLMTHLVERGWVCVTVNYRLGARRPGPDQRWPTMIVDVKRAVAWVRAHIAEHGGDAGFVTISGASAGGHLASLAALTAGDPAWQPGFADADTSLAAAVPVYGVHDFSVDEHGLFALLEGKVIGTARHADADTWRRASPLHRAADAHRAGTAPPLFVVHGSADTIVSVGQSRRFVRRLRELGADVRYAELPRAQHGFDMLPTARTGHHVRAVHRFLDAVHARYRATRRPGRAVGSGLPHD